MAEAEAVAALREYCLMKFDMKALARDCCRDGTAKRRFLQEGISFLGQAFSEPRLLALGHAFEQVTKARRLPVNTPVLTAKAIRSLK